MTNETIRDHDAPGVAANPAAEAPARKRWPTVLLALSLTLNLAVLGMVAGAWVRDESDTRRVPPPERSAMRDTGIGPFVDAMPRDARTRVGQALRSELGSLGPDREALATDFSNMLAALRAEPYDPSVLETVLAAQHARIEMRVSAGRKVVLDEIAAMSPEDRAVFADRLEQGFSDAMRGAMAGMQGGPNGPGGPGGPGNPGAGPNGAGMNGRGMMVPPAAE